MDGFEALDRIRERHPACGCVLMTAQPLEMVAEGSRQRGILRILSKPFSLSEMEGNLLAEMGASA
jgi:CheY-like chemotaxis protein